jgi:N-acetylneuraminate synthase
MRVVDLGGVLVGDGQPAYIVAELGINHSGSVVTAEKLIDAAAYAGAQAVKLQKRTVDVVYPKHVLDAPRESPWGTTTREQKYGLELGERAYRDLARYARAKGLAFTASCWDEGALDDVLEWTSPPWLKIASAVLTWEPGVRDPLLRAHRSTRLPLVVSTGMCALSTIAEALEVLACPERIVLLACTSTYPCDDDEINLRTIGTLRDAFDLPVGYSGHERGVGPSVWAVARHHACMVERHITLDRASYGSDQAASLEPKGFNLLVRDIRNGERVDGSDVKRVLPSEEPVREKLRRRAS